MIRPTTPPDCPALLAFLVAMGLFNESETEPLKTMLAQYFAGETEGDFWLTDADDEPVGVAYCAPERMTSGTWNVLLLAVRPDRQGKGRGAALMRFVERKLAAQGERMLLVETSGTEDFAGARAFYRKCGYEQEARIRDFYDAGDDKIVFRKLLIGAGETVPEQDFADAAVGRDAH